MRTGPQPVHPTTLVRSVVENLDLTAIASRMDRRLRADLVELVRYSVRELTEPADPDTDTESVTERLESIARRWAQRELPIEILHRAVHAAVSASLQWWARGVTWSDGRIVRAEGADLIDALRTLSAAVARGYAAEVRAMTTEGRIAAVSLASGLLAGRADGTRTAGYAAALSNSYLVVAIAIGAHPQENDPRLDARVVARRKLRRIQAELATGCRPHTLSLLSVDGGTILIPADTPAADTPAADTPAVDTDDVDTGDVATDHVGTGDVATDHVGTGDVATDHVGTGDVATDHVGTGDVETGDVGIGGVGTSDVRIGGVGIGDVGIGGVGTGDVGIGGVGTSDVRIGGVGTGDVGTGDVGTDHPGTEQRVSELIDRLTEVAGAPITATFVEAAQAAIPQSADLAHELLDLAMHLGRGPGLHRFRDLACEYQLSRPGRANRRIRSVLDPLRAEPTLLDTLRAYLGPPGTQDTIARRLGISVGTLRRRLTRIEALTGLNPETATDSWHLRSSLVAHTVTGEKLGSNAENTGSPLDRAG
ncbi:PucR family transcriptional regulator [Nocardia macrotermitis]|uniref:PucR family transcriptional regulator n=1 Tax=Nocardia macrotermitis TaxID=2585198 RepID=UPI00129669FF|nr:helix-turn-helix domain-containing protein [Nocardia macrotermitis]